jgi:predicted AlkP superfamily pyrophosphatase or phosphodiesterase
MRMHDHRELAPTPLCRGAGLLFALVLSSLAALLSNGCRSPETPTIPRDVPVVIISIDTLRADHLPLFGYKEVETPNIDSLARDSILFTNAWSAVPLTLPSHVAMLTGLLPPDNKVRNNIGYTLDPAVSTLP